jgi:hypothetical protein
MPVDPNERFSIWPLSGEEALKKALGAEEDEGAEEVEETPEDEEPEG